MREIGELARAWKGMNAGYVAKHLWIIKNFGKASRCENPHCKSENPKRYEWANISGKYKRGVSDYMQLCPSCHRKMDYGDKCKHGHLFTESNTYFTPKGHRQCRTCQKNRESKFKQKQKDNE